MTNPGTEKWDARYGAESDSSQPEACYALRKYHYLLPESGRALDLACGLGGNAFFLSERGFETEAWDSSTVAIERIKAQLASRELALTPSVRDVVVNPPEANSFDIIVVSRFLHRELVPTLVQALNQHGVIFYQTFVVGNSGGPSRPEFLLLPNELLVLFEGLEVRAFEDNLDCGDNKLGLRNESVLIAQKKTMSGLSAQPQKSATGPENNSSRLTKTPVTRSRGNAAKPGEVNNMSAIDKFEAMLEKGQDGDMLRFTLGNAYWKDSQPEKAVVHLEKAVELKPEWSAAWKILGRAYFDSDNLHKAIEVFEQGLVVADAQGDKQTEKEIGVFLKRAKKALDQK